MMVIMNELCSDESFKMLGKYAIKNSKGISKCTQTYIKTE